MSIEADSAAETAGAPDDTAASEPMVVNPIVVDLGKIRRKHVKRLKRGEGRLVGEVMDVLDEVHSQVGYELDDPTLVPIVMIYERKRKKPSRRTIELPF